MTQVNANQQSPFIKGMSKGLSMAVKGNDQTKEGTAIVTTSLVMLLQENWSNPNFQTIINHCAGVHVNAKEQPEAFAASWAYWSELLDGARFNPLRKDDEDKDKLSVEDRREANDPINARTRTLRFATAVAYGLFKSGIDWSGANLTGTKHAYMFAMSDDNMLRCFPKREKSIRKSPYKMMIINTFGDYTFKALRAIGTEYLVKDGHKKAAPEKPTRAVPVRDIVKTMGDTVENADAKAFDKTTRLAAFSALIKLVDALNDSNVAGHLSSDIVRPFREHVAARFEELSKEEKAA